MSRLISPERVGGTNDYTPAQMAARRALLAKIMRVYQRYGFEELETPAMEFSNVLLGEHGDNRIWRTQPWSISDIMRKLGDGKMTDEDAIRHLHSLTGADEIALRFDHTVPLARFVAANTGMLQPPWRRWCFGPVWRGDTTGAGRFSQFYQLDADIVGDSSLVADAEIIAMMTEVLAAVTTRPTTVRWNSRKLINALALELGITGTVVNAETLQEEPRANALFRALDKLDKIGWDGVREILERTPANEHDTLVLALDTRQIGVVEQFLDATIQTDSADAAFTRLESVIGSVPVGAEGLADMRHVAGMLASMGVSRACVDFSVARGLGYYTGIVFESGIKGAERFGSPYSGGRYDNLVARFTGDPLPCTGASVGFDRLFAILEELGELPQLSASPVDVVIADFGASRDSKGDPTVRAMALDVLTRVRRLGVSACIYDGMNPSKMKAVFSYADRIGAKRVIIIGEREAAARSVNVKHLASRVENTVGLEELQRFVTDP